MAQSIRKPLKEGVAKVPVVIQMEALECGAARLAMILAYYGKWIPLTQVRQDCGVSRDGSSLKKMYLAAKNYGMEAKGFRMEPEALKKEATFPCIIHWDFKHFVVLNGFKKNKAVINDPARGTVQVPMEEFDRSFTGPCLIMEPGEQFQPSGKRRSVADYAKKSLKGASAAIVFVVLTTIISYLFGAINPVMSRIFFDRLLNGEAPSWVQPFLLVMVLLCVLQITVEWIRTIYSIKINGKLEIEGNTSYVWKVLHLPMEFFSQRMAGDLLNRQTANATIANTLVNTVGPLFLKLNPVIIQAISLVGTVVLYYAAIASQVNTAQYYAFNAAYGRLMGAFTALAGIAISVSQVKPILEMAEPILKTSPELTGEKAGVGKLTGHIEMNHISFRYSEEMPYMFQDLSLSVQPGEYVAIVGRTGCGKSTLVRLLLGFEKPEKGTVFYDHYDLNHSDPRSIRKQIGVVMQNGQLLNNDIYSNITLSAPLLSVDDAWEAAEIAGIAEDIKNMPMGMFTMISEGEGGISGGQKQRLMIARAIAPKPRILMLQEGAIIEEGTYEELIEKGGEFADLVARQRLDQSD